MIIEKDEEDFYFTPIEDREIIINLVNGEVENVNDIFVFKNSEYFLRVSIFELMLASNLCDFLLPIVEKFDTENESKKAPTQKQKRVSKEVKQLIRTIEEENLARLIDDSLSNKDEVLFKKLMKIKKKMK